MDKYFNNYVACSKLFLYIMLTIITLMGRNAFAEKIVISGQMIIDKPTTYKNVVIDMNNGSFRVINKATLQLENCKVSGTISPQNSQLFHLMNGTLLLKNNQFQLRSKNISPDPINSRYYVIQASNGEINIQNNKFSIGSSYTVGWLTTNKYYSGNVIINSNKISNFHAGIILQNAYNFKIINNKFLKISNCNIFILGGNKGLIKNNNILFPGNNNVGDGIDIIDSSNIRIEGNTILAGSCYSIVILRAKDLFIIGNNIMSGITYAIYISNSFSGIKSSLSSFNHIFYKYQPKLQSNGNIQIIRNYFSQNRYGLTANHVDHLIVKNNIFIQRFSNANERKFWTDNLLLLKDINDLDWQQNNYKEAYTQDLDGDNRLSTKIFEFPISNGVYQT